MKTTTRKIVSTHVCAVLATIATFSSAIHSASAAANATDTWNGSFSANWADAANWDTTGNGPPANGDSLVFGAHGLGSTLVDNLGTTLTTYGVTFVNSGFTINPSAGESLFLSGQVFGNTIGISAGSPTPINLNLSLDWGFYTFGNGGALTLGGTLTANTGAVAYFDSVSTGVAFNPSLDGAGLISGLGGAGLMYNSGNSTVTPSGLATVSGGYVVPLSTFTSYSSGAIATGATANVALTATAATTYTTANGVTVNTITANQPGNAGGTSTTTVNVTGTLTLGGTSGIGGIYALSGTGGAEANLLTIANTSSGILTAGSTGVGGTIVIGATDTTTASFAPNAMTVAAAIQDNGSGKVSVSKVGYSSISMSSTANTFSGNLYIDEGQVQAGTTFGSGSVYVASGATLFINNSTSGGNTFNNNFFISPGTGFGGDLASGSQGSLMPGSIILGTSQVNLNTGGVGTITLQGAPIAISTVAMALSAPPAGDRFIGNGTVSYFFNGPIAGTGTLDLAAIPHACTYEWQNTSATPNSWAGGLIIESPLSNPSSARTVVVMLGGTGHTQIPHGPGTGDVLLYSGANRGSFQTGSSATLNMNGNNATINGLWGYSAANISGNMVVENTSATTATLTIGDNAASGSYGGVTTDTSAHLLNLTKNGAGTQTFTGALNHHGSTTINNGTFALGSGSSLPNSTPITVAAVAVLDVTGISTLNVASGQTLNCVGQVNGNITVSGTVQSLDPIGTLTDTGSLTIGTGSTYIWDINDATGVAGTSDGWSLLSVGGTISVSSTPASPMTINVTSLSGNSPGSALNFNSATSYSFQIAHAANGISGFSGTSQFNIVTSPNFQNYPNGAPQWSVSVVNDNSGPGQSLMLNFNGFSAFAPSGSLPSGAVTINQNGGNAPTTANFTVTANSAGTGPSFTWYEQGTQLSGTSGTTPWGGGSYTINTVGYTSTLTISQADGGAPWPSYSDTGAISVTASETYNSATQMSTSSEQLNVIDLPYNVNVVSSLANENNLDNGSVGTPIAAGAVTFLSATASGTSPFTYQWYLNGNAINGATHSNYTVNIAANNSGTYTVNVINSAGNASPNTTVTINPVTQVPNQIIFDPLNYPFQAHDGATLWSAIGLTNVYNQATGVGLSWVAASGGDMDCELPNWNQAYAGYPPNGDVPPTYDIWPWPGLADSFPTTDSPLPGSDGIYQDSAHNSDVRLPFGTGGSIGSGTVYLSFVINMGQGGNYVAGNDYLCGFGYNNGTTTAAGIHNVGIYIQTLASGYAQLGVFKTATTVSGPNLSTVLNPGVNGNWSPNLMVRDETIFVICRLTVNPAGGSSGALWIDPAPGTFYAGEGNLPTPDVSDSASSGAPDVATPPVTADFIYSKITQSPASRTYAIFRVGTTWASVTPPSAPTLTVNNAALGCPPNNTAIFTSTNAGNPVSTYNWYFNGSVTPMSDGLQGDGASIFGSQTSALTIASATGAEVGTYTVTGSNTDPASNLTDTGSATGTLSFYQPPMNIVYTGTSVVISWPTAGTSCFTLNKTTSLLPTISWTPVTGGTAGVSGPNNTYTISPAPAVPTYYSLIANP